MRDLLDLLNEANQEVPGWLESMSYDSRTMGIGRSRGGGARRLDPLNWIFFDPVNNV